MSAAMRVGVTFRKVPEHPGVWSAWSKSSEAPGAWFLVPVNDEARATGKSHITVRIVKSHDTGIPEIAKVL